MLDVLRGIAVLGIYWIGVAAFGLPYGANALPTLLGAADKLDLGFWAMTEVYMEGAMRGLFSMLFGASALAFLSESRLHTQGVELVDLFYRRNLLLILFGLIHAWLLLWPHDVLYDYGLIGLFLYPIRHFSTRKLLITGCLAVAFANMQVSLTTDPALPADSLNQSGLAVEEDQAFVDWLKSQMDEDLALYRSDYKSIFLAQSETVIGNQSLLVYKKNFFDIGGMMLIGMALFRLGVLTGQRSLGFYLALMLGSYLIGGVMRGWDVYQAFASHFSPRMLLAMEQVNYDIGRLPVALGHVGLGGILCKLARDAWLIRALAATGRLALTHYIGQTLFSILFFYGFGLGFFGRFERSELFLICIVVWVFQIGFSLLWLKRFRIGPLEWLWRSSIYLRLQPLRLDSPAAGKSN